MFTECYKIKCDYLVLDKCKLGYTPRVCDILDSKRTSPYNLTDKKAVWEKAGLDLNGVYFYGGAFSNFVGPPITLEGNLYLSVEHWFQSQKAVNPHEARKIRMQPDTWVAKRLGNRCELRSDWEDVKYEIMLRGLRVKFSHPQYKEILLGTGDKPIYEDSPVDYVWGIGADGTGQNLLGKALMQIREEFKEETKKPQRHKGA